jgi:hypothetical protein
MQLCPVPVALAKPELPIAPIEKPVGVDVGYPKPGNENVGKLLSEGPNHPD